MQGELLNMKRLTSSLLVVMFMGIALIGIAQAVNAEKVELDFWTFWGSQTRRPVIEKIIDNFNKSQDRIIVKHTYLPWGDIWTKNLASIAAGNPADIIVNDINSVAFRAINDQVVDITEYLPEGIEEEYYPSLWNTVTYNDRVYALPFVTDTRFLFYNKDAFREVGLDPNDPPETWDELWEYANKLDKKNGSHYERIGFYPLWGNIGMDVWCINGSAGSSYINYEFERPAINTIANLETWKWVKKWRDKYGDSTINAWSTDLGDQPSHPFLSGRLAMIVNTATFYTQIRDYAEDLDVGVVPIPEALPGSGHWSWGGGFVAEIPKGSKHVEEAVEFLLYLTGPEGAGYWAAKNFDNVANIGGSLRAAESPLLSEKGKGVYRMAAENMNWTIMTPHPLFAPEYWNLVNPEMDAFMLGKKSAEEALESAQKAVEELIENEKGRN